MLAKPKRSFRCMFGFPKALANPEAPSPQYYTQYKFADSSALVFHVWYYQFAGQGRKEGDLLIPGSQIA